MDDKKIVQVGLTCEKEDQLNQIIKNVDHFNRSHNGIYIELEYMESPPDERQYTGKYRLIFTFANRDIQKAFWFGYW